MSYTREQNITASQILKDRHSAALSAHDVRHAKVVREVPVIAQYEAQLAQTGLDVIKAVGMGEDAQQYIEGLAQVNLNIQKCIKDELVSHGYPENYLDTPWTCPKCEDTGVVGGYICDCKKEVLRQLNVADLESSSPAAVCRFDNFSLDYYSDRPDPMFGISPRERAEEIFEYCRDYADDFDAHSGSLYMNGATGLGKTHLSLAIANVVARKGYNIVYGSAQNILSGLEREKFGGNNSGEEETRVLNCDLLIIDDLGSEFTNTFGTAEIYNIINTRINLDKPVIISTNLSEVEFEKRYSQRVLSRIIGNYTSLSFAGKDIRQIKNSD